MPDPTQEARQVVLREYRKLRQWHRPYNAMRVVMERAAYVVAVDAEIGEISPQLVARFTAADKYCSAISDRIALQAERRGIEQHKSFWHHGGLPL